MYASAIRVYSTTLIIYTRHRRRNPSNDICGTRSFFVDLRSQGIYCNTQITAHQIRKLITSPSVHFQLLGFCQYFFIHSVRYIPFFTRDRFLCYVYLGISIVSRDFEMQLFFQKSADSNLSMNERMNGCCLLFV